MVVLASGFLVMSVGAAAVPVNNEQAAPGVPEPTVAGPKLDQIIVSQELDRSKALTEIIAGNFDTYFIDIVAPADKARARAAEEVSTFPAFGLYDELTFNPVEQDQAPSVGFPNGFPRNPFALREAREAMRYLVDRDFIVRDIYSGGAIAMTSPWHPLSGDYARHITAFLQFDDKYAFDPAKGRTQMFTALQGRGWTIGTDGLWHDPEGRLVTIKIFRRTQDERFQIGAYYGSLLQGLNFNVELIGRTSAAGVYSGPPDQYVWHIYTAGWIQTALTAWDDGQLDFFAACGIGQLFCAEGFYQPPAELDDIAKKLLNGQYQSVTERSQLIVRGTELALQESLQMHIDARASVWVTNARLTGMTWDLFGGNTNDWGLKTATVPADPISGMRVAKALNLEMFIDGWNPWVSPGWLYDGVQRNYMVDPSMSPHPHTGRWMNFRNNATPTTRAPGDPLGNFTVPATAMLFNNETLVWDPVGAGVTAISKVTLDMVFGNWHHGQPITMDDVLHGWSMLTRRARGDIDAVPGINNGATGAEKAFERDVLKGIVVVDSDTLEVYVDFWHPDLQEIAAVASYFPSAPWEVQELAAKMVLDQKAVINDGDIGGTGLPWLDITKGDVMPDLAADLTAYQTANHIPPGMSTYITTAEATARWDALATWYTDRGHFWPSNGPFFLDVVDVPNRQSVFTAFRTGYPFDETKWDALTTVAIPEVTFAPTPPVFFAGTPAVFDFSVTVGPAPTDDFDGSWFLRDVSTGAFLEIAPGVSEGVPAKLGTGSYRIELSASKTDELLLGNFEVISIVVGHAAAIPTITRSSFLILPSTEWFEALLEARLGIVEDDVDDLGSNLGGIRTDLDSLASSTTGLLALVTAMAILAVIAVVVAVVSVVLIVRRGRPPPMKQSDLGDDLPPT